MALQFITEINIGHKERRLIRSHVMKGRNKGRSRPKRKTLINTYETKECFQADERYGRSWVATKEVQALDCKHVLSQKRLLWNELSLTSFPACLSQDLRGLLYQWFWTVSKIIYPPELCSDLNLSQYAWFQYVVEDKTYFHCTMAISASFADRFGGKIKVFPEALQHMSLVHNSLNERLSGPEAIRDTTMAVVTMLTIYHMMHHQRPNGRVHFKGLCRMIQLRGGLAKLARENVVLAQKPWRLDIEFALQDGTLMHFPPHELPLSESNRSQALISSALVVNRNDLYRGLDRQILIFLLDTTQLTKRLDVIKESNRISPTEYAEIVYGRLHHLLRFSPLGRARTMDPLNNSPKSSCCHDNTYARVRIQPSSIRSFGQPSSKRIANLRFCDRP
ncbi:hypothetical protein P280DRAFT_472215 [Massarina eburnea CBS 473.64]|uniref:Uncharacterized protein n=1 Tax=Massarina eburnea CBS 473.64 TaxID=1395130 RepID=A0A6A6RT04_9PLEO|nr:hypothetical protein P280DRAFT_472215 [Massarina eburnea CBS 473.64]